MAQVWFSAIGDYSDHIINCANDAEAIRISEKMEMDFMNHKSDLFPTAIFWDSKIVKEYHWRWGLNNG